MTDLAEIATDFTLTIDGEGVAGSSTLDVINPATGRVFASCPAAGREELDRAVDAARRAFPAWRDLSFEQRADRIRRFCQSLREHQDALAYLLTMEQGKPLQQAKDEITRAASQSEGMTRIPIVPQVLEDNDQRRIELQWFPLGVAGIITPWNAPINLAAGPRCTRATRSS
jgi:acyl-CoA reductase-like NAD-dependent aldehyde dehydrogenase